MGKENARRRRSTARFCRGRRLWRRALLVVVPLIALPVIGACGGERHTSDAPTGSSVTSTTATQASLITSTPFAEAVDSRLPADGSTTVRLEIDGTDARSVGQMRTVIRARLRHFGAVPSSISQSKSEITVSWARRNVPDSVVTLLLAPGHFQLRPVFETSKGGCVDETPPGKSRPNEEIRLSGTDNVVRCYRLGPSLLSDPTVADATLEGTNNRLRLRITLAAPDAARLSALAIPPRGSGIGCVLDTALLATPSTLDPRPNAPLVAPTMTTELARLQGAILVGGAYPQPPLAGELKRLPT